MLFGVSGLLLLLLLLPCIGDHFSTDHVNIDEDLYFPTDTLEIGKQLSPEEETELTIMIRYQRHAFAFSDEELGCCNVAKAKFDIGEAKPLYQRPYRMGIRKRSRKTGNRYVQGISPN